MATFEEIKTSDADQPWSGRGLPPGVRRALVAALGALVVVLIPYAIPGAERFRVWTPEEEPPFAGMFQPDTAGPMVAEAAGSVGAVTGLEEGEIEALMATEALPEGAASAVETEGEQPEAAPAEESSRVVVPAETWEGVEVLIEDPHGAMTPFYESLERTALDEEGAVTRISHWGDSAIGADGMTSVTRRLLQRRFGDSGHGFILVEAGSDWYEHKDVRWEREHWRALKIIDEGAADGRYGFGGVQAMGYLGADARFGTVDEGPVGRRVGRFEIFHMQAPKHGDLKIWVDGEEQGVLHTAAEDKRDAVHVVEVPDGPHQLRLRVVGGGPVRLYGVVLERDRPGVVYDSLGLVGARGSRLLNADAEHWERQLRLRRPNLMVLMYGGNELVDRDMDMEWYREKFTALVRRFRDSRPDAACLVLSPLDHGERHRGGIRSDPMLLEMMPIQREVALAEGCAWYSVFEAMGGEGAMGRWFRSEPRLGWGDLAHPTHHGARVLGDRFYRALMKAFSDWLEAER
ncbi:MAG: GDSL-type esterase/lipase family protein [Myxococcota bacterium]